jgi:hypothetical protein
MIADAASAVSTQAAQINLYTKIWNVLIETKF